MTTRKDIISTIEALQTESGLTCSYAASWSKPKLEEALTTLKQRIQTRAEVAAERQRMNALNAVVGDMESLYQPDDTAADAMAKDAAWSLANSMGVYFKYKRLATAAVGMAQRVEALQAHIGKEVQGAGRVTQADVDKATAGMIRQLAGVRGLHDSVGSISPHTIVDYLQEAYPVVLREDLRDDDR